MKIMSAAAGAGIDTTPALMKALKTIEISGVLPISSRTYISKEELDKVHFEIADLAENLAGLYIKKADSEALLELKLAKILSAASTFKGRTQWNDGETYASIVNKLKQLILAGEPLIFVIPAGGGKAPNALKTGSVITPDVSDWVSWAHLEAIGRSISKIYSPGALVLSLPDAHLHSGDMGFPLEETLAYMVAAKSDLNQLGFSHVKLVDTEKILPVNYAQEVNDWAVKIKSNGQIDPLILRSAKEQVESLVYSVNTRIYAWPFERLVEAYVALINKGDTTSFRAVQDAELIRARVEGAIWHYMGVNQTIRSLDIPSHAAAYFGKTESYFRLTVHAKPGEPRPQMIQSNQMSRPALLPMHSLGFRYENKGKARFANIFEVEARVRGYKAVMEKDTGRFLYYKPSQY